MQYSESITAQNLETVKVYKLEPFADLRGANLSGADLSGADLSRVNLSRANLYMADLSRANLSGVKIHLYSKWGIAIQDGKISIGCKTKTIPEWDVWFASKEEYETPRNSPEFKHIYAHYVAVKAYVEALNILT